MHYRAWREPSVDGDLDPDATEAYHATAETQRRAGWRLEDESMCVRCELYANDIEAYAVCPECDMCKACGCVCGKGHEWLQR